GVNVQPERLGFVLKQLPPLQLDPTYPTPERARLLESLERSVDVQMRDATVTQAAESLAKASGVAITVDPGVTMEKRVTAEAHGVPLRAVLEAIARQLGVMIAPAAESKGVILKPWPSLEVNGDRTVLAGPSAPWSADWGMVPGSSWMRIL